MMYRHLLICLSLLATILLSGCIGFERKSETPALPQYAGSGGMTEWNIKPEAYLYHYENGFTGSDALGWPEQLQFVWSRLGAAANCQIDFDKPQMVTRLQQHFGESYATHELNGIGFHRIQSHKVPLFCSEERMKKIEYQLKKYHRGAFN